MSFDAWCVNRKDGERIRIGRALLDTTLIEPGKRPSRNGLSLVADQLLSDRLRVAMRSDIVFQINEG